MKRIVLIGSYDRSLINFRGHLLQEMVRQGYQVFACAPNASEEVQNELKRIGVTYINVSINRTGLTPLKDIMTILKFILIFIKLKPDIILPYTAKPVIYGSIAARFVRIKNIYSIITGLGYVFTNNRYKHKISGKLIIRLYSIALKSNRKIFFQNLDDRNLFFQLGIVKKKEKTVLVNGSGVDINSYLPVPIPDDLIFLMIARLLKDKGVREYVEAAKIIKSKYPYIIFRLAGWIDSNPNSISNTELNSWIEDGVIDYMGKVDDVRPVILSSSVYVLPSYREGTPRTVLEAMSMGRPIITTNSPGCRETVQEGINGFLVPVRNVNKLVEAMERFIISPSLIAKMGKESRNIAKKKYDVKKVNKLIIDAIGL